MNASIGRREVLRRFVGFGAFATTMGRVRVRANSANDKLNLGIVGTANRAQGNIQGVEGENIVAICDVNSEYLGAASERFPEATVYADFRRLLEQKNIDAVVVSTADHTHAPAAAGALRSGRHVYCEKPLTHSVHEARVLANLAAETGLATQMGTQIHDTENYRRVVEAIRAGAVGTVREVHVWCDKTWSGGERPTDTTPVPDYLDWDLWLGPAPERPYHPTYQPANWRRWWDFGNGTLGDMGCHLVDLPFWALDLETPKRIRAQGPTPHPETAPEWLHVEYDFATSNQGSPVLLTWSDGKHQPWHLDQVPGPHWSQGILFMGDKGLLLADYGRLLLLPEERSSEFRFPEPTLVPSIGHHAEWLKACKTGSPTTCNFGYGGNLTETILLGTIAFRAGEEVHWDGPGMKITNSANAAQYLKREYRKGWTL